MPASALPEFSIENRGDGTATIFDRGVAIGSIELDAYDVSANDHGFQVTYVAQGLVVKPSAGSNEYGYVGIASRTAATVDDAQHYEEAHSLAKAQVEARHAAYADTMGLGTSVVFRSTNNSHVAAGTVGVVEGKPTPTTLDVFFVDEGIALRGVHASLFAPEGDAD